MGGNPDLLRSIECNSLNSVRIARIRLAAIQMVLVVVLKKIEGDILSGVCFVGLWDSHSLLVFVVVPKALCLGIGITFLVMGVVSHIQVRSGLKTQGRMTDTLESHLCRIGKSKFSYL